jgi:hypothetical protein
MKIKNGPVHKFISAIKSFHMALQKNTNGNQLFNVPNDEDGRKFLKDVAKYINRGKVTYKNRGRGSRKNAGTDAYLPLNNAEWIAVYVYPKAKKSVNSF